MLVVGDCDGEFVGIVCRCVDMVCIFDDVFDVGFGVDGN